MDLTEFKYGKNRFSASTFKNKVQSTSKILKSWKNGFNEIVSDNISSDGLRTPQFGALCAIRSYWTVNDKVATIVMPTGTGKSETMLATIASENIPRTLIVVPSNLLRSQFYEKIKHFGLLYEIGILKKSVIPPNTFLFAEGIKDIKIFEDYISKSNIIVTTMALASKLSSEKLEILTEKIDVLIIDEAHHISSKTWSAFKEHFYRNRILQFTATPFREDGKKVDGEIIYNFPLRLAQEKGYFQKINFEPIEEYDENKSDFTIAHRSISILEDDIKNGYDHILLVRASDVKRAEELYSKIYEKNYSKYNPVLITSKQNKTDVKVALANLKSYKSKIVVCVNMFGEGIDIPNLKIAAIHDKYRSLPITLQFIGRFARGSTKLGSAKLITNIANNDIADALKDLYEKDSDWSKLLEEKSSEYVNKELSLQKFIKGFDTNFTGEVNLSLIKPKVSMQAYRTQDTSWNWRNWALEFDSTICKSFINSDEQTLVIVEPRELSVRWTSQQNLNDLEWNYYILYWNKEKEILFLNSSDLAKGRKVVQNIFSTEPVLINSEQVFKCLHGIKRLALGTVGLNSAIDGPVRYRMFAGIDVAEGISESSKINSYKSNLFGNGYSGNGKISIGCTYKGTIWSRWVESIDYWKDWCNNIIDKILDPSINVQDIIDGVLIPTVIQSIPNKKPYRIDWPNDLEFETQKNIMLLNTSGEYNINNVDILLEEDQSISDSITFFIKNEYFSEKFVLTIDNDNYSIKSEGDVKTEIKLGNKPYISLTDFFKDNTPTIWFVDGSSIQGNILVELRESNITTFPPSLIFPWKWTGVNINVESQLNRKTKSKKSDSIQFYLIKELLNTLSYSIVFDDDGSGEIADVVAIKEKAESIEVSLYHCKYAHGKNPGKRVKDLYEVCGQADKSVFWKQDLIGMIDRMIYRENQRINSDQLSRFELGDIPKLKTIRNKLMIQQSSLEIIIVQPGVKSTTITDDMHSILSTAHSYCMDTYSVKLSLICS